MALCRHLLLLVFFTVALSAADPFCPKVVLVVTFEIGADTGDQPGELQYWVEREQLDGSLTVPGLDHPVRFNDRGICAVVAGTTARAGLQIMALGLDQRFDFSRSYWLVNGIAGVNPNITTEGSAAWARYVIDGDIAYEIDPREAPADWPYGVMALGNKTPQAAPTIPSWAPKPMVWKLNPALVEWAYELTRNVVLPDTPEAVAHRALYAGFPAALAPPAVVYGDSFGSCRYWHGARMQQWADDWTKLYTGGMGVCAMTNMEDHGIANALQRLDTLEKLDFQRVLFLRAGSNFSMPPTGQTAAESLVSEYRGRLLALEAAWRTGSPVVRALVKDWTHYANTLPTRDK